MASMGDCTTATCPVHDGFFESPPSLVGSAIFLAAFAILIPINLWTGMRCKTARYSLTIGTGLLFEVVGYIGRVLLRSDVARVSSFVLYMLGTIMGPTFITAAVYQILPHIVVLYGKEFTLVSRPAYFEVFFTAIGLCTLAFQAAGVAVATTGATQDEMGRGSDILLAGMAMQMASIVAFLVVYWYFIHQIHHRIYILDTTFQDVYLSAKFKIFLLCMQLAVSLILVRTVVRFVSILGGWTSVLSQSELATLLLDGLLVLAACILLTVVPVGAAFRSAWQSTSPFCRGHGDVALPLHQRRGCRGPRDISPPLPTALPHAYSPRAYHPTSPPNPPLVNSSPGAGRPPYGWAYGQVSQTSPGPSPSASDFVRRQHLVKGDELW